jgi:hypothetical protein
MSNLASVQFVRTEHSGHLEARASILDPCSVINPTTLSGEKIQFLTWEMPLAEKKTPPHSGEFVLFCFSKLILVRFLKFWDHQQGIYEDNAPNLTSLLLLCKSSTKLSNDEITPQTIPFPSITILIPSLQYIYATKSSGTIAGRQVNH